LANAAVSGQANANANAFFDFSQFLKDGVFFYQCSGANSLLSKFFERYFAELGGPFQAETLSGFVVPKLGNLITFGTAHRITSLSHKSKIRNFLRLDGTPTRFDKDTPKPMMMPDIPRFRRIFQASASFWFKVQSLWGKKFRKEKPKCSSIL
jgi:hypothetical protein